MIEVTIPIKTISEANNREHWTKKSARAKKQRNTARMFLLNEGIKSQGFSLPIVIKLTRIGKRNLDSDNLARSFKAVRDGIADALGIDDGASELRWEYGQEKGDYSIRVSIC